MSLHRLLYTSMATDQFDRDQFFDFVESCKRHNEKRDITGTILFHDPFFVQILEGHMEPINHLLQTIYKDKRNDNLYLRDFRAVDRRYYESWGMKGFTLDTILNSEEFSATTRFSVSVQGSLNPSVMTAEELYTLMDQLYELEIGPSEPEPSS